MKIRRESSDLSLKKGLKNTLILKVPFYGSLAAY